jgi:hypothetical protein
MQLRASVLVDVPLSTVVPSSVSRAAPGTSASVREQQNSGYRYSGGGALTVTASVASIGGKAQTEGEVFERRRARC